MPGLGVAAVKAKIDTGARTSSLHAFDLTYFRRKGVRWTRFAVHPLQRTSKPEVQCEAPVVEMRRVRSSSGHVSERPVIQTVIAIGEQNWTIELTLASRDEMGFRMLLGRQALRKRCIIDPGRSYVAGPKLRVKRAKRKRENDAP